MNKVIYVQSHWKRNYKYVNKKVPTGETKKGLLGGEKKVFEEVRERVKSDIMYGTVDAERLLIDTQKAIYSLNEDGYEVVSVSNVISGNHKHSVHENRSYGYGYSYTEGVTIIGKKIQHLQQVD